MEFWVLGPIEVTEGGRSLAIGGPKPRAALAALLLEANRIVSVEGLVDAIWGEQPPPSARNALQTYVSRLRRVLGTETLCRHPSGYRLVAEPDMIDAGRFERLLAEGRAALAAGNPSTGHRALSPDAYARARAVGLTMDRAAVRAFVDRLADDRP